MEFVRSIDGYDHLWAVKYPEKDADELTLLFRNWSNANYLLDFFFSNLEDLKNFFHIQRVSDAIQDSVEDARVLQKLILEVPYKEEIDGLFHPLSLSDNRVMEMTREKARNWDRLNHASWMRVYAVRVEKNVFIVTGGAIKLTHYMEDRPHTRLELDKLNNCKEFLKDNGIFDQDSFIDYIKEE